MTPKRLLETQTFKKKGSLYSEKNILVFFSRSIEHDIYQGTNYKSPKAILTITVEVIRSFL